MNRATPLALATLLLAGCTAEPPPAPPLADPPIAFVEAFANPLRKVTVEASGGPVGDSWLIFSTADRIELKGGERFAQLAPAAAVAFFATAAPDQAASLKADDLVCLAWRDVTAGADSGAFLLFELGSGRYFFRRWGPPPTA